MIYRMIEKSVFWLNALPINGGMSSTISPRTLMIGTTIDFSKHCEIEFGAYAPFAIITNEIIAQYNLKDEGVWVYIKIRQVMPGLKQAGLIANERLTLHLAKFGYTPSTKTPVLWRHATCNISFSLVVDDFGVKCR